MRYTDEPKNDPVTWETQAVCWGCKRPLALKASDLNHGKGRVMFNCICYTHNGIPEDKIPKDILRVIHKSLLDPPETGD